MSSTRDREIVVSRVVDAPRELAWLAMTEPAHLVQWWGPTGFTATVRQMDVRPGGVWAMTMHGPDGTDYPNHSVFREVAYPERIVFACGAEPGKPELFISTWTFEAVGEATRVTIWMVFPSAEARDAVVRDYGAIEGAEQTLGRLAAHLAETGVAARSVVIERVVDAPPAVVFGCWSDAARLARWWAPHGFTNPVCEADVRTGGSWRIVMRAPDGTEYPCGGVYLEVVPGERLAFTNIATNAAGEAVLDGLTEVSFAAVGGGTRLTVQTRGIALVDFAKAYLAGMEVGWRQSLERLDVEVAGEGGVAQHGGFDALAEQ